MKTTSLHGQERRLKLERLELENQKLKEEIAATKAKRIIACFSAGYAFAVAAIKLSKLLL